MTRCFEGKRVFITGASSGIGAALARELARQGARVALAARREDRLQQVHEQISQAGGEAISIVCDVTRRPMLDAAVAQAVEAFGGIDVAVANAGFLVTGQLAELTTEDFRRQFDTNVFGVIDTAYATLPHLVASKGQLVIVSSVLGRLGLPATSAYCASKFALVGLAESLYYELAEQGVAVTCINPGIVDSEIRIVDNRGVLQPDREDPASPWLRVPTDKAARTIARYIHKGKFEAVITGHGKVATWVGRHFPRTLRFLIRQGARRKIDVLEGRKRGHRL